MFIYHTNRCPGVQEKSPFGWGWSTPTEDADGTEAALVLFFTTTKDTKAHESGNALKIISHGFEIFVLEQTVRLGAHSSLLGKPTVPPTNKCHTLRETNDSSVTRRARGVVFYF